MRVSDPIAPNVVDPAPHYGVRPVGTWVIAGFLTLTVIVIWTLVAILFATRS